jgi:hypothetical protein
MEWVVIVALAALAIEFCVIAWEASKDSHK